MQYIREKVLSGELLSGAWCNLGSSLTVEMAAIIGFDWILIDQEHGPGDNVTLLNQIQAVGGRSSAPIVRITWNEMPRFKRALDLGAMGIMVPYVQTAQEAQYAVDSMRYSPEGSRGVASSPRAAGFSLNFKEYYSAANTNLLLAAQVETGKTLKNLEEIAIVDGVDVLFVGPLDLSISLGMPEQFENPDFREILTKVAKTARSKGKAAGILVPNPDFIEMVCKMGFTFIAAGSDGGMVLTGMQNALNGFPE